MPIGVEVIDALADRIATTSASLDAATHTLLTDLRAFDEARGWARQGASTFSQWLSWRCGIDLGAAREKIRVALALGSLPLMDEGLRTGELSFSKVRAMTRVATTENEATLVELARHATGAQMERICRLYAGTLPADPRKVLESRRFVVRDLGDGMVRLEIVLCSEEAGRVVAACNASAETRVDGLVALAEERLRGNRQDRPPVEVSVHLSAETLQGWGAEGGVSSATAERLLCDAGVVPVVVDREGTPMDVGRKRRTIPAALRRALVARDEGCRFPGCTHRRWIDAHHVVPWSKGGETSLENTVLLCTFHHTLVHEGGFRMERDEAGLRFLDPRGRIVPGNGIRRAVAIAAVSPPRPPRPRDIDYHAAVGAVWAAS